MQVVDQPCAHCGQRIVTILDGVGCPDCEVAFHKACMQDEGACPRCARDLTADRKAEAIYQEQIAPVVQKRYRTLKRMRRSRIGDLIVSRETLPV
jgi:hypothetical protein